MMRLRNLGPLVLAALLALALAPRAHAFESHAAVLSGDPAPGVPGAQFDDIDVAGFGISELSAFSPPILDNAGGIAFQARLDPDFGGIQPDVDDRGVWKPDGAGGFLLVIRRGDEAPDLPGALFDGIVQGGGGLLLNDLGQVGFGGILQVGPGGIALADSRVVYGPDGAGGIELLAGGGVSPPGVGGAKLNSFRAPSPIPVEQGPLLLNVLGQVAYLGVLQLGVGGVDPLGLDDSAIWGPVGGGNPGLVAREFRPAPGTPIGTVFDDMLLFAPPFLQLNEPGQVAFIRLLDPFSLSNVTPQTDSGIWRQTAAGSLALVVREGSAVAGGPAGATYGTPGFPALPSAFAALDLNDLGDVAFVATLNHGPGGVDETADEGIWGPDAAGTLTRLIAEGDPAPGTAGAVFGTTLIANPITMQKLIAFDAPMINDARELAFLGLLLEGVGDATADNDLGVWGPDGAGGLALVMREGDPVPDTPPGTTYNAINRVVMTQTGLIAFLATLSTPTNGLQRALFLYDPAVGTHLVHMETSYVEVTPGSFRQSNFVVAIHPASDQFVNEAGHVAFLTGLDSIALTNGSFQEGLFVVTEPGAKVACMDGFDNDLDFTTDFPFDPGCEDEFDESELSETLECDDDVDNDGDGDIDFPDDPGCQVLSDATERFDCEDGIDNDVDGNTDFPADLGCLSSEDPLEDFDCDDGIDNDGDTLIDFPIDGGCNGAQDRTERRDCDDGIDNDGDTFIDLVDPGCAAPGGKIENPQCDDGLDNDGDTKIDHPADPDCTAGSDNNESPEDPGNLFCGFGNEMVLLLLPLLGLTRLRRLR